MGEPTSFKATVAALEEGAATLDFDNEELGRRFIERPAVCDIEGIQEGDRLAVHVEVGWGKVDVAFERIEEEVQARRLPPPQHSAEYEPELQPAAGPWKSVAEEGEPDEYKCYLVEVAVKGARGRENTDTCVVRYDRHAGWQVDEWHTDVLRYAEIYT